MRRAFGKAALVAAIAIVAAGAAFADDDDKDDRRPWPMVPGYGMMGPGYGGGPGYHMGQGYGMGPGMTGPGYGGGYGPGMGPGMMGPGMMGQGYGPGPGYHMGQGYGMGPGMMGPGYGRGYGPGMMGPGGMPGYGHRASIDADGDGTISDTEAAGFFETVFARFDADDDGKLTLQEFATTCFGPCPRVAWGSDGMKDWQDRKEARFEEIDGNGDDTVTQEEFLAYGKKRYNASDRDEDGKVTVWEFSGRRYF